MHRREPRGDSVAPLDENVAEERRRRRMRAMPDLKLRGGRLKEPGGSRLPVHTSGNGCRARGGVGCIVQLV
eukprot:934929-Heterocapsa_arctica.AAC.1